MTAPAFAVHLANFDGPFDLLLSLIAKHEMDVTEVALATVTDEFIAYLRTCGAELELEQASSFLVVAATLLDLKAARLLPSGRVEDEEDLALLEARDLLFARLLQYRAYQSAAGWLAGRLAEEGRRYPRSVSLEERYVGLLPDVLLALSPAQFAALAERALAPRPEPSVDLEHLHAAAVSVPEQATILAVRLRETGTASFRALCADADGVQEVVGRFLALLELYREGTVSFEQVAPLADLTVRWVGEAVS